ncbi:MAG TPA: hypothetical protein VLV50_08015 [Stellaceae bacterium]|nr:hypothetical protein [Stellaceae bacterium]
MASARTTVLFALLVAGFVAAPPAARAQQGLPEAGASSLPSGSEVTQPLRRGPNGEIEVVTPEALRKSGEALCAPDALCVGEGGAYKTLAAALAAAKPGATIDIIGGTYHEAAVITVPRVTLRGSAGRPLFDCAGQALGEGRACFFLAASGITLETLEVSGAAEACIANAHGDDFAVRDVICHDSQSGVRGDGGKVLIERSEFFANGRGGTEGNAEFTNGCNLSVRGATFRDAASGSELSAACAKVEITDATFRGMTSEHTLEFPAAGDVLVYRSSFTELPSAGQDIITYASKSCDYPGNLVLKEVSVANSRVDARLRNFNRCKAGTVALQEVTVSGYAVGIEGFVSDQGGNILDPQHRGPPP